MSAILLFGFLIGMRHAMESDHLAALAALATRSPSIGYTAWQGAVWGLGHTITLFVVCSVVLSLDAAIPEHLPQGLEAAVSVMLMALGTDVIRRLTRERIHFRSHFYDDASRHTHAHGHRGGEPHERWRHEHPHPRAFPVRALLVGLMHGMAGSAALILLTLQTVTSPLLGLAYVALFGLGSIFGMVALSALIAVPLRYSARTATGLQNGLQFVIGVTTIVIGVELFFENMRLFTGSGT